MKLFDDLEKADVGSDDATEEPNSEDNNVLDSPEVNKEDINIIVGPEIGLNYYDILLEPLTLSL